MQRLEHSHAFGQHIRRRGESRTLIVIAITGVMMVVEVTAGIVYGSMALLADGLHMASHAAALSINAFAYVYARRHAHDARFSFGTGKVNTLGGYTGAVLLAGFALVMAWESVHRLIAPVEIAFNQAIAVAVVGLIVNGLSVWILGVHHHDDGHGGHEHEPHEHGPGTEPAAFDHDHSHEQSESVDETDDHVHDHADEPEHADHAHAHHDHNLIAAYLHVLADALTSVLAIFALLGAKYLGFVWADPLMGIVGAVLVARWSISLLKTTSHVLLDQEAPEAVREAIRESIEGSDDNRISDLHVWAVGPNLYSLIVSVVTHEPKPPEHYKALVPDGLGVVHTVVEVHSSRDDGHGHALS